MLRSVIDAGTGISRATVFNALDDLTASGLVVRAGAGSGAARYETAGHAHHHFVCARCGKISDVPAADEATVMATMQAHFDGHIEDVQIIYRGICAECLRDR